MMDSDYLSPGYSRKLRPGVGLRGLRQPSFSANEKMHHPLYRNGQQTRYAVNVLNAIRIRGTIIRSIYPLVLAACLEALVVVTLHRVFKLPVFFDDRMITMLGSGIGLLLAFRTNRGFERYNNGAQSLFQLWTNLMIQTRVVARSVWTGVQATTPEALMEKLGMMNMLLAVALATKHSLRGNQDPQLEEDVLTLLPSEVRDAMRLPCSFNTVLRAERQRNTQQSPVSTASPDVGVTSPTSDFNVHQSTKPSSTTTPPILPAVPPLPQKYDQGQGALRGRTGARSPNPSETLTSIITNSSPSHNYPNAHLRDKMTPGTVLSAPLDMVSHVSAYVRRQRRAGHVDPEDASSLTSSLTALSDSVARFEQLLYVPVPWSYDVHIKQVLCLYFAALPFQLVRAHGWVTVFVVLVGSLTFFGTDAIAGEISDPFGSDQYDLPLDYFCKRLREDIEYIMERPLEIEESTSPVYHVHLPPVSENWNKNK